VERATEKRYTWLALRTLLSPLAGAIALTVAFAGAEACRDSSADGVQATTVSASSAPPTDVVLPGVDISAMTPRERHEWSSVVSRVLAPCPSVAVSIAQCVRENRSCGACFQAAKWIAKTVRDGASEDQIEHAYRERFDPAMVRTLPVDGSPTRGPEDAPVTIVEFADFECPHCRLAVPVVDAVLEAHPGKVRLVYKSFTLPFHARGEPAARAAFAAGAQGKFWEMEHLLFERQQNLEDSDLERYAKLLKLDLTQWRADISSPSVSDRIAHDHALGEGLKLKGTPTIYVNGRELDVEGDEQLENRVAGELGVAPAAPLPADSALTTPTPLSAAPAPKHP